MTPASSLLSQHERDLTEALQITDDPSTLLRARSYLNRLTHAQIELAHAPGAAACIAAEWGPNGLQPAIRDVLSSARFHGLADEVAHHFHAVVERHAA